VKIDADNRELYSGMIRLHILHHAGREAIFGAGMAEELARHGYRISPGTLYPILHGLEKRGYLKSKEERSCRSARRFYKITVPGRRALRTAKLRIRELFGELIEGK
jgi:PadR family transcriptional regulator PadR